MPLIAASQPNSAPQPNAASQRNSIVDANNKFGIALYKKVAGVNEVTPQEPTKNLFFSPFSIGSAMAMTAAGAQQETLQQMLATLHLSPNYHSEYKTLFAQLNKSTQTELMIANRLWGQSGEPFYPSFLNLLSQNYGADLATMDFKTQPDQSRVVINNWVQKKTRDKIKDLLKPGAINSLTRLVLTNAIYFKGKWADPFNEDATKIDVFHTSQKIKKSVHFMRILSDFRYAETAELQYVDLPYEGYDVSMEVLLPKPGISLLEVEKKLSPEYLTNILKTSSGHQVDLSLPRFRAESEFQLKETLTNMGMTLAFNDEKANFGGMRALNPKQNFSISEIIHKAFVDVNESGTEAAAATALEILAGAAPMPEPPPPKIFKANRPFLILIRHLKSNTILFMGRVSQP